MPVSSELRRGRLAVDHQTHELRAADVHLLHRPRPVRFDGLHADAPARRRSACFCGLHDQIHHFALALGQRRQPRCGAQTLRASR